MIAVHPQYINDINGKKSMVILPVKEFEIIMEQLEDLDDIRLYDEAKKNDTGERISMEETFKMIEAKRKKEIKKEIF